MTAGYNPGFYIDEAMNAETIVRVVGGSGKRIGIERLSAQAGHANATTTLLYARPADAKSRCLRIAF